MKSLWVLMVFCSLSSCNSNGDVNLNNVGKKFDSSAQKLYDSTKADAIRVKDKIKEKLHSQDSLSK